MTLAPACLTVVASYTVVTLQFNNIFNSIVSILMSCYYSKAYMKFINCLNSNDILVDFLHDKIYFKRLASHFKIGLKPFGGIDVNKTLMPACLSIVASYTIIALQFNNIV
ncbi:uncharacterized protein LOC134795179 [Cydia splendana]|uniref:uncharacterized protein LOC134795179 n=1 Tax=Cydia splendana TaxID=1100963 RepID=UPI00300D363A